ncbi:unnamed protein product [Moneuplotes crassus]|uniref:Calcineurin-like phosphoesterase domain-containing protein n=1 Tax=Euplotes crassus TaxID=5936 RepID=A0AAD1XHJ5_EUPCR|nr:unnamed protein product [Moneuplotes crassus]
MFIKLLPLVVALCACFGSSYSSARDQKKTLKYSDSPKWENFIPHSSKEQVQRFFAIGDFGDYKSKENIDAMTDIMNKLAAKDQYDFITTMGDNFYPNGIESMNDLDLPDKIMSFFQKGNIRNLKMFPTLGNHDCFSDYYNQVLYSDYNKQWEMESDYYELKYNLKDDPSKYLVMLMTNTCLLACNTAFKLEPGENGSGCDEMNVDIGNESVQIHYQWLENKLKKYSKDPDVAWLGVVGHHPPILEASLKNDMLPLLQKYKVDFFLAGHKHQFEYANIDYDEEIRFPGKDRGPVLKDCKKKKVKEIINTESREQYFVKGKELHQFMIGGSGRKMKNICPYKDQDGHVYIQNAQKNGLATIEVDSKNFNVKYHNDGDLSHFYSVTISSE